jgi:hypothetical protein
MPLLIGYCRNPACKFSGSCRHFVPLDGQHATAELLRICYCSCLGMQHDIQDTSIPVAAHMPAPTAASPLPLPLAPGLTPVSAPIITPSTLASRAIPTDSRGAPLQHAAYPSSHGSEARSFLGVANIRKMGQATKAKAESNDNFGVFDPTHQVRIRV